MQGRGPRGATCPTPTTTHYPASPCARALDHRPCPWSPCPTHPMRTRRAPAPCAPLRAPRCGTPRRLPPRKSRPRWYRFDPEDPVAHLGVAVALLARDWMHRTLGAPLDAVDGRQVGPGVGEMREPGQREVVVDRVRPAMPTPDALSGVVEHLGGQPPPGPSLTACRPCQRHRSPRPAAHPRARPRVPPGLAAVGRSRPAR